MYLPRNIWFVLVVIMISSCSTETLDVTSPTDKLGVTVKPMEGKAYDKITFSVNYDGKSYPFPNRTGVGNRRSEVLWKFEAEICF